jgi:hypothetical protein
MTTITVEIDKDKDLLALKEFAGRLGLKYQVEEREGILYTDEVKDMLDKRYHDYREGVVEMVSAEESQKKIQDLLAAESK